MKQALLDTDTLSLFHKRHPKIVRRAAQHVRQYGCLIFSELSYYEVTRGLKAIGATTQLAQFEQFCQSHRILPFSHNAAIVAADIWSDLKRRGLPIGEVDTLIAGVAHYCAATRPGDRFLLLCAPECSWHQKLNRKA